MRKFKIKVSGTTDLIMHNGRTANRLDPATKEISQAYKAFKQNETDESFNDLARAEFMGGLYQVESIGPCWPAENFHSALKNAGAKIKRGRGNLKRPVASAVTFDTTDFPLIYAAFGGRTAPRKPDELWDDPNYRLTKAVKVQSSKVMRTRPLFKTWQFEATGLLDTEILDLDDLRATAVTAGQLVGLGDWRPEKTGSYGKFTAEVTDLGEYDPLKAS